MRCNATLPGTRFVTLQYWTQTSNQFAFSNLQVLRAGNASGSCATCMVMASFAPPASGIKVYPVDQMMYSGSLAAYVNRATLLDGIKMTGDNQGISGPSTELKAYDISLDGPYSDITGEGRRGGGICNQHAIGRVCVCGSGIKYGGAVCGGEAGRLGCKQRNARAVQGGSGGLLGGGRSCALTWEGTCHDMLPRTHAGVRRQICAVL